MKQIENDLSSTVEDVRVFIAQSVCDAWYLINELLFSERNVSSICRVAQRTSNRLYWFYHQSRMPFSKTPFSNIITPLRRHQGKGFEFSPIKQSGVHHLFFSRGFRACLMLLRMLDINASIKQVDLGAGQQHDEDFLKLNPRHRIPILVDWWFYRDRIEGNHGVSCECEKARESALSSELKGLYFDATVLFEQNAIAIVSGGSENVECDNWNSRCLF